MGCDGGTIPRRDELVRLKKKPEQKDKDSEREFRWLYCAITQHRLQEPIVMCGLGRLYSKQNVIEQLLEKEKMGDSIKHIKNLKDVKTLNLTPNPAYVEEDKCNGLLDTRHAPYICKVMGLEMSGNFSFVGLWSCGCVMSERALKLIKKSASVCPLCQLPFSVEDVVILNGSDSDIELMEAKIAMRDAKRKASTKAKKDKKDKSADKNKPNDEVKLEKVESNETSKQMTADDRPSTSKASLPIKIEPIKKPNKLLLKTKVVCNPKRLGDDSNDCLQDPQLKRLKTDFSVANDPKATDVYKSLFTTHKSEKEQSRAHWVTYNPFYN